MTDFNQFYTNNEKANNNFKETFTVETLKLSQGGEDFNVLPCKDKQGKCFFACGLIRGAVSQKLADKICSSDIRKTSVRFFGTIDYYYV